MAKKSKYEGSTRQNIYDFCVEYWSENQCSPAIIEIVDGVGVNSTSVVAYHLAQLEKDGLIFRGGHKGAARRTRIVGSVWLAPSEIEEYRFEAWREKSRELASAVKKLEIAPDEYIREHEGDWSRND